MMKTGGYEFPSQNEMLYFIFYVIEKDIGKNDKFN